MRKALVKRGDKIVEVTIDENTYKKGGSNLIKRKDGSYSQRGLWDNIRANKGSGKKPTKQMLEQERKIRSKYQEGGEESGQMDQILDQIEDALEQGANPQEILEQLVGMGMDENSAQQLIKKAIQDIQEDAGENEMQTEEMQKGGNKKALSSSVKTASNSDVLSQTYNYQDQNKSNTANVSRIINSYDDGSPNTTSYSYLSPEANFFYNTSTGVNFNNAEPITPEQIDFYKRKIAEGLNIPYDFERGGSYGKLSKFFKAQTGGESNKPNLSKNTDTVNNSGGTDGELYKIALEQYKFFQDNPQAWIDDPDYKNPDGTFNLCLDCINVDWNNPSHINDVTRLIEEGFTTGPHYDETKMAYANKLQEFQMSPPVYGRLKQKKLGGLVRAQTGLETKEGRKKNLVSEADYSKMILAEKEKKEIEEKKKIEEKAKKDSFYFSNPQRWKNYDETKFNNPNLQPRILKQCGGGDMVWDYQPCPEEVETPQPPKKPRGTYNNSSTGKYYYIWDEESKNTRKIDSSELQDYFDKYDLSYRSGESGGYDNAPVNANLMYDANLPTGSYYDLSSTQDGQPLYYYNTANAQFFPNQNKQMGGDVDIFADGGSYRVSKTNERKGKTHKVVGPGGVTKYFGDPKLGEKSKSKYGKKGFYARHKKNLAKNPFFRAYARATWAEGGEPSYMNEPEYKTNSFISKVKEMGQMESDKSLYDNVMEQSQQILMQMGGVQKIGYNGISDSNLASMQGMQDKYNQNSNIFKAFTDVSKSVIDSKGDKIKSAMKIAGAAGAAALGLPPGVGAKVGEMAGEATVGAATSVNNTTQNVIKNLESPTAYSDFKQGQNNQSTAQNPTQQQQPASSGSNPLSGLSGILGGSGSSSGGGSGDALGSMLKGIISNPEMLTSLIGARRGGALRRFQGGAQNSVPGYTSDMIVDPYSMWGLNQNNITLPQQPQQYTIADQSLNTPALEPINYFEQGNYTNFQGPLNQANQPGITTESTNPIKDPLLKPPVQQDQNNKGKKPIGPAIASFIESFGNKQRAQELEANIEQATTNSDTLFGFNRGNNRGQYAINTGRLTPDQYVMGSTQGVPALSSAKYGGIQKPGVYMSYPTATPESVVYGKPDKKMSNTLSPVDRDKANLEAEVGETVMTPAGDDGIPKFFKIGGKRHSEGGTPLHLPENSFIFSDTRSMLLGKNMLEEFGITGKKKKTPAEVAKILGKGYEKYVKTIQDPNSDSIERRTAEMMIQTQINNLGKLALAQESKKGFPQGIPMISVPYMASIGVSAEQVLPQQQQIPEGMPQGNMMPPEMMQQMMQMQEMPMAKYGMQKYQTGREKQTDPYLFSSTSTPESPNIAQRLLGPLFNLAQGLPENTAPVPTKVIPKTFIKGFGEGQTGEERLKKFISTANELSGNDFKVLTDEYQGRLDAIDILKQGLINNNITIDQYKTRKDEIVKEIDALQSQMESYDIPGSWVGIPWSAQNKLEDLADILLEEKQSLDEVESYANTRTEGQNKINELISERSKIEELYKDPSVTPVNKFKFKDDLKNIDKAIAFEKYNLESFERAFRGVNNFRYSPKTDAVYYDPKNNKRVTNDVSPERYTYDDYMKTRPVSVEDPVVSSEDITNMDLRMPTAVDSSAVSGSTTVAPDTSAATEAPVEEVKQNKKIKTTSKTAKKKSKFKIASNAVEE